MLFDRIQDLCKEKGINPSKLEQELGFGRGTLYTWRKSTPGTDKVSMVADYFDVSIDYLLCKTDVRSKFDTVSKPQVVVLQRAGEELTDEQLDDIVAYAKYRYPNKFKDR